jgi:hypothetical protein
MSWPNDPRPALAAVHLRDRIQKLRPDLPASGFGILGDADHATRFSDHNPWKKDAAGRGVARALDVPLAGESNRRFARRLRRIAKGWPLLRRKPHPAFGRHGYIISDRRIASFKTGWKWVRYNGSNPHTTHVHVSFGRAESRYDNERSWTRIRRRHVR